MIKDAFFTKSYRDEGGLKYSVHEILPDQRIIQRGDGLPTRYAARVAAQGMVPSHVREL